MDRIYLAIIATALLVLSRNARPVLTWASTASVMSTSSVRFQELQRHFLGLARGAFARI
jgi:hypothetical protein